MRCPTVVVDVCLLAKACAGGEGVKLVCRVPFPLVDLAEVLDERQRFSGSTADDLSCT